MGLHEDFRRQGEFLFRWRSYLPLLLVLPFVGALFSPRALEGARWQAADELFGAFCFLVSCAGLAVRCLTAGYRAGGTSGRGMKLLAKQLNSTGMYSLVRHPLYLGNFLVGFGMALFLQTWWFAALYGFAFALYYERIMYAEEEFLRDQFGPSFETWSARTPAFFPRLGGWRRPPLPFSVKAVLRREYTTLLLVGAGFPILDAARSLLAGGPPLRPAWTVVLGLSVSAYVVLNVLTRRTRVLDLGGR